LRYEWALVNARFASVTQGTEVWVDSLRFLMDAARVEPTSPRDFQYWILHARLLRFLRRDPALSLRRADSLALSPKEKGLVEVEEAQLLRAKGLINDAFARLRRAIRVHPHHPSLLQTAAEMAGQAGYDPTIFISGQGPIPEEMVRRGQEVPPLSDVTLNLLIERL
jgi:hypothetical protein